MSKKRYKGWNGGDDRHYGPNRVEINTSDSELSTSSQLLNTGLGWNRDYAKDNVTKSGPDPSWGRTGPAILQQFEADNSEERYFSGVNHVSEVPEWAKAFDTTDVNFGTDEEWNKLSDSEKEVLDEIEIMNKLRYGAGWEEVTKAQIAAHRHYQARKATVDERWEGFGLSDEEHAEKMGSDLKTRVATILEKDYDGEQDAFLQAREHGNSYLDFQELPYQDPAFGHLYDKGAHPMNYTTGADNLGKKSSRVSFLDGEENEAIFNRAYREDYMRGRDEALDDEMPKGFFSELTNLAWDGLGGSEEKTVYDYVQEGKAYFKRVKD